MYSDEHISDGAEVFSGKERKELSLILVYVLKAEAEVMLLCLSWDTGRSVFKVPCSVEAEMRLLKHTGDT